MNKELFLEQLLITYNEYNKINNTFIKDNYWRVEYSTRCISGYIQHAADNHHCCFEIDNWQKLKIDTLLDVLISNGFILNIN